MWLAQVSHLLPLSSAAQFQEDTACAPLTADLGGLKSEHPLPNAFGMQAGDANEKNVPQVGWWQMANVAD